MRPVETLRPYDRHARINDAAVAGVARSIGRFGFRQPIVADAAGVIICGHVRYKAARMLGLRKVPVHVAEDLTDAQARAYRLADNRLAQIAEWDDELLGRELTELQAMDCDLESLGFGEIELQELLAGADGEGLEDEAPAPPATAESKPGELYELGRHRLLVGDAASADDMARLMGGRQADLLLTDPPYNVQYEGKTADALTIENDSMDDETFRRFLARAFAAADEAMRPGAIFYVWHADSEGFNFRAACRDVGWRVRQCLVWVKNAMVLGRQDYQWRHEPCLYGWKDGAAHTWLGDRSQTTITGADPAWGLAKVSEGWCVTIAGRSHLVTGRRVRIREYASSVLVFDRPSRSEDHPTMKPVDLFEYQIRNSARRGELILDPFAGSGTTVVAAERAGRVACVMELDPRYADVIRRRWAECLAGEGCDWRAATPPVNGRRRR